VGPQRLRVAAAGVACVVSIDHVVSVADRIPGWSGRAVTITRRTFLAGGLGAIFVLPAHHRPDHYHGRTRPDPTGWLYPSESLYPSELLFPSGP
jgi:hypothetical protein